MLENFTLTIIQEHYSMESIFTFSIKGVATYNRTVSLHAHIKQLKKYTSYALDNTDNYTILYSEMLVPLHVYTYNIYVMVSKQSNKLVSYFSKLALALVKQLGCLPP